MRSFSIVRLRRWAKPVAKRGPLTHRRASPDRCRRPGRLDCMATTDPHLKRVVADANEAEESIPLDLYLPSGRLAT